MSLEYPLLSNSISVDVQKLNEFLEALTKLNPTEVDGISVGAKRLVEVSSGKWQWQEYNGSTWAPVPFFQHSVDQLDGYHAAITPAANTVAVRNASGVLEDNITGNAATASSAATLSQTLPVNKGGTGATTSEAARSNLGVPPTSHASTNTTHGVGNATQYGHLKLSDATNSSSGVTGGVAATPAAVKAAKDAANNAMTKASTLATASAPGIVNPGTGMTVDAAGALNVNFNNTVTSTSTTQAATANAVKMAYDKAVEAASKGVLPLGYIYAWPYSVPMDGSIQINGQLLNRQLYADLFAYAQSHGQVITEAEWQEKAAQQGGYCNFYSEGDGSTTFRAPKFAPYQKFTTVSSDAGKYYEAGLPAITGDIDAGYDGSSQWLGLFNSGSGCFKTSGNYNQRYPSVVAGGRNYTGMSFDASGSDKTYGNSDTVRPESMDWIVCVVAFGVATNVGSVDVANVMSAVSQVQANPNLQGIAHTIETWKSSDGTSWYRKYSDGFIEQGGVCYTGQYGTITLNIPFKTTTYNCQLTMTSGNGGYSSTGGMSIGVKNGSKSTTSFAWNATGVGDPSLSTSPFNWIACGY